MHNLHRTLGLHAFLIGALSLAACGDHDDDDTPSDPDVVVTKSGTVRGSSTTSMRSFLGIPYAAPPTGSARWKPPTAPAKFDGERDATKLATHCPQLATPFGSTMNSSEDCLYLNVFTPTTVGKHPVMFWIHGGSFHVSQSDGFDPSNLVAQGVVVVTINHRLGALGFLAHPALTDEGGGASGNFGLMDQQMALHWVQDNIEAFGGDADQVTIFGQSAGGFSVHAHLVITSSEGLFARAIIESGAYANPPGRQPTLAMSERTGVAVLAAAGCADPCELNAMRDLGVDDVLAAQAMVPAVTAGWTPAIDGKLLTMGVGAAYLSGAFQKVPIIEGSNHDEYRLFVATNELNPPDDPAGPLKPENYLASMNAIFGEMSGTSLAGLYPLFAYDNNPGLAQATAGTDAVFACAMLRASQALAAHTKVYVYEFSDPKAPKFLLPEVPDFEYGAAHASEVAYIFNPSEEKLSSEQADLSRSMVEYWTNFAKSGDPNGEALPDWPAYNRESDGVLALVPGEGGIEVTTEFDTFHKCDLLAPATK